MQDLEGIMGMVAKLPRTFIRIEPGGRTIIYQEQKDRMQKIYEGPYTTVSCALISALKEIGKL